MVIYLSRRRRWNMPRKAVTRTDSKVRSDGCLGGAEFGTALNQRWKQSREKGEPVSLLLLDLDGLHELNTVHGHDEGDRALNATIAALAKAIRAGSCTVSIGVASTPRDAKTPEDLMRKADLALYAAKDQGGSTVALTPSDDMVLKSSYYSSAQLGRLRSLAERMKKKEAVLLREALDDLLRKHERS